MTASQEAQRLGVPSFSKSSPRPPRLRVKMDCAGGTDNQARKPFRAIEAKKRERQQSEARREREKQFNRKVELNAAMGWVHAELNQTLS